MSRCLSHSILQLHFDITLLPGPDNTRNVRSARVRTGALFACRSTASDTAPRRVLSVTLTLTLSSRPQCRWRPLLLPRFHPVGVLGGALAVLRGSQRRRFRYHRSITERIEHGNEKTYHKSKC